MHTEPSPRTYTVHDIPERTMEIIHRALKQYTDFLGSDTKEAVNWQDVIDMFDHLLW